ncbi:hypothetical protein BXU08_00965 [Sphingomonas sp. LM7]|nr:hypothetical protein BXU08_00965 [Sphingomonas sp. LM7]
MYRLARKLLPWLLVGALLTGAVLFYLDVTRTSHDKAINADVLQPLREQKDLPFGTVVPRDNRWEANAFIAEYRDGKIAVLILDDHYWGGDPAYRSGNGVIGDDISYGLLCSIPAQARARRVALDPAVDIMIKSHCSDVR